MPTLKYAVRGSCKVNSGDQNILIYINQGDFISLLIGMLFFFFSMVGYFVCFELLLLVFGINIFFENIPPGKGITINEAAFGMVIFALFTTPFLILSLHLLKRNVTVFNKSEEIVTVYDGLFGWHKTQWFLADYPQVECFPKNESTLCSLISNPFNTKYFEIKLSGSKGYTGKLCFAKNSEEKALKIVDEIKIFLGECKE